MKTQLLTIIFLLIILSVKSQEFGTNDLRVSDMGTNGVTSFFALDPEVAYSTTDSKYLVVWNADDNTGAVVDNEFEIYGQFIDASGSETGANDFRISFNNTDGDTNFRTDRPDIAWNSTTNQFLVVWEGETSVNGETEIYGQIVNANGTLSGSNFRISDTGAEGDTNFDAKRPEVSYNSTNNGYLVVWESDETINNNIEIYGQRLSATGTEIGTNDFQISTQLPVGNTSFTTSEPDVAWNSSSNEYLVVWQGETSTDNEKEIYGQRVDNDGTILSSNFKISDMGTDGVTGFSALYTKLSYNSINDEFLVIWQGADLINNEYEVYGQRISSTGTEIGTNDFRITTVTNINSGYDAWRPEVTWNSTNNEYFIVYRSDNDVDNEFEVYAQLVTNLGVLDGSSFALSDMGPANDTSFSADDCVVATNGLNDYLIAWKGDDDIAPLVNNEREIFIQMYKNGTLSITENEFESRIKIYPNPSSNYLNFNKRLLGQSVKIYNVLGKKIMESIIYSNNSINIKNLNKGLYFLRFENNVTSKFVKK